MTPKDCFTCESASAADTQAWGARLAPLLKKGDVVLLNAHLGGGKTTFVQGVVKKAGFRHRAVSPTFIVAQTYEAKVPIHHLDFYRLSQKEILDRGLQDYFLGQGEISPGILLVEWAERCKKLWPREYLEISLTLKKRDSSREISFCATGDRYRQMVEKLKKAA